MRKLISAASTAALLAAIALAGVNPAEAGATRANFDKQNQYINSFCSKYRGADQCNDWRAGYTKWTSDQYRNFYRRHENDKEFANPEAAALFGMGRGGAATEAAPVEGSNAND
jgi:hypothetical protein